MQVTVSCPDCSRQLRLPEEVMGSSVRCPLCKTVFTARAPQGSARPAPVPVEDDLPLLPLADDDEPPRPRQRDFRDRDDEVRPRRAWRDPDEDREDRRPRRRPSPARGFRLFVHRDPHDRLRGPFDAEMGADGLEFWRGRGREIVVPVGTPVEYLGDGHLLIEIEGRRIEVTPVHPQGMHDELAREVLAVLEKPDEPFQMPIKPRGMVVWMMLLPLGIPVLAKLLGNDVAGLGGMICFSILAAILMLVTMIVVLQRALSTIKRAWWAVGLALFGYLILGIALRVDHSGNSAPPDFSRWVPFAPIDSGYRAEFPGFPEPNTQVVPTLPIHNQVNQLYMLDLGEGTQMITGFGTPPDLQSAMQQIGNRVIFSIDVLQSTVQSITLEGKTGVEVRFTCYDGRSGISRYFSNGNRLFAIVFVSRKLSPDSREAKRFLDSFAFDPSTGWPGPGTPQLGPRPSEPVRPGNPVGPPVNPFVRPQNPVNPPRNLTLFTIDPVAGVPSTPMVTSRDGSKLIFVGRDFRLRIIDPRTMRVTTFNAANNGQPVGVAADGSVIALVQGNLPTTLVPATRKLQKIVATGGNYSSIALSPDGKVIATGTADRPGMPWEVRLFEVESKKEKSTLRGFFGKVEGMAFNHDGNTLAVAGSLEPKIRLYDIANGTETAQLPGHIFTVRCLATSPVSNLLASAGDDRTARIWDLNRKRQSFVLFGHNGGVTTVAFSPDGRTLASGSDDRTVRLWDVASGRFLHTLPHDLGVGSVAFGPEGKTLFVRLKGGNLGRWDLEPIDALKNRPPAPEPAP